MKIDPDCLRTLRQQKRLTRAQLAGSVRNHRAHDPTFGKRTTDIPKVPRGHAAPLG